MKIFVIILISLFTTGITANSYCDQQYEQLGIVTNNIKQNVPLIIVLSKLVVISPIIVHLVFIKHNICVEENGVLLVFTVIPKQEVEDGQ